MDQKIQIKLDVDSFPDTVSKLSSVEILGMLVDTDGNRWLNPKYLTIVFRNVTVEGSSVPSGEFADPKEDGGKKAAARASRPKTTVDEIEYELVSAKIKWGNVLDVVFTANAPKADQLVNIQTARAFTEEGETFTKNFVSKHQTDGAVTKLPINQKIQITLDMGPFPDTVSKLSEVELSGIHRVWISERIWTNGKNLTIVFRNVTVER